jgi:hypothetical protein
VPGKKTKFDTALCGLASIERQEVTMKRFCLVLGLVGLGILSTACSGATNEPGPFAEATDLESRMAADLGTPVAIEQDGHSTFVIARGASRTIAASDDLGEGVTRWIERYAGDLKMTGSPHVVGTGTDGSGLRHVRLGTSVPAGVEAPGLGCGECQSCCRFSFVSYEAVSRASALAMVS